MGHMRARTLLQAGLLAFGLALVPSAVRAQTPEPVNLVPWEANAQPEELARPAADFSWPRVIRGQAGGGMYEPGIPDVIIPAPIGSSHPERGGPYFGGQFVLMQMTNPLESQPIGFRGFFDSTGALGGKVGQFVGDAEQVLNAHDAGGPGTYVPGFKLEAGYKLKDGTSIEFEWMYLQPTHYFHVANFVPPVFAFGNPSLENSFITAPVYNFNSWFAGIQNKVAGLPPGSVYGVWNGADEMIVDFIQRYQQYQIGTRTPILDVPDMNYRSYGYMGLRFSWIWEKFRWTTFSSDANGNPGGPLDTGVYSNIVSNRMYGPYIACGNECWIGNNFAVNFDIGGALFLDIVKERAEYQTGQKNAPGYVKRSRTTYQIAPEVTAVLGLSWFPIENIQFKIGYDFMAFFNTLAATHPVSFNVGALDPPYNSVIRFYDGFQAACVINF
jgi:hypothetical protein